jgi:hypothetical protein
MFKAKTLRSKIASDTEKRFLPKIVGCILYFGRSDGQPWAMGYADRA